MATKAPGKKTAAKKMDRKRMDPKLVASIQRYEVSYVAEVTGKTAAQVRQAIADQGHSRIRVVKALGGKKAPAKKQERT